MVKPISETRNANIIVYVWFTYSFSDKKLKASCNIKNNNSECTKYTKKKKKLKKVRSNSRLGLLCSSTLVLNMK